VGKCKDEIIRSIYYQEKAKAKFVIYKTKYKKISLGNVQTRNVIFETMHKPKKATPRTLLY
jgi:hypothetical protein